MSKLIDTAEYEVEVVSKYLTYHRLRRSDSDYIITVSPGDLMPHYLENLEAEGFRVAGPVRVVGRGKTVVPYRRERPGYATVGDLIAELQKHRLNLPVSIALQPLHRGPVAGGIDVVYRTGDGVQLRGREILDR
jgi:hypothetical protein